MKKVLYTDFVSTEDIINDMLEDKVFKKAIMRHNLYKFWSQVAGSKLAQKSKPYSMIGSTMVVACQNAVVAQELMLKKTQLLTNFRPYAKSLKITLKDFKFDSKKWVEEKEEY